MSTLEEDQASFLRKVFLLLTFFCLLDLQQLVEHMFLKLEEAQYLTRIGGTFTKRRISVLLHLDDTYHYVVAFDDAL